jgi:hypothetical protein
VSMRAWKTPAVVLGFPAWYSSLSGGPILED